MFFSLVRKERKGQKEESIPLLNTFCRLAATGANTLPRPSNHSVATATGSKRSSADSDLLLCHIRLWQTSRFRFGCASVCEHSKIRVILAIQNIVTPHPSRFARHLLPQEKAGKNSCFRQRRYQTHARLALSAGVQTMRARICSAISCDMFARVV